MGNGIADVATSEKEFDTPGVRCHCCYLCLEVSFNVLKVNQGSESTVWTDLCCNFTKLLLFCLFSGSLTTVPLLYISWFVNQDIADSGHSNIMITSIKSWIRFSVGFFFFFLNLILKTTKGNFLLIFYLKISQLGFTVLFKQICCHNKESCLISPN